jgi:parallel beta-helix repeat protein
MSQISTYHDQAQAIMKDCKNLCNIDLRQMLSNHSPLLKIGRSALEALQREVLDVLAQDPFETVDLNDAEVSIWIISKPQDKCFFFLKKNCSGRIHCKSKMKNLLNSPPSCGINMQAASKNLQALMESVSRINGTVRHVPSPSYPMITSAISAAVDGDCIVVQPGIYREHLIINKSITVIGVVGANGERACLEWAGKDSGVSLHGRDMSLKYLWVRCFGNSGPSWKGCIHIEGKGVTVEGCDISSKGSELECSGISLGGDSQDVIIRGCHVHDCTGSGVISPSGSFQVLDCHIYHNAYAGVDIHKKAKGIVENCSIHNLSRAGILVYEGGTGQVFDNDIFANKSAHICIDTTGSCLMKGNHVHGGSNAGVYLHSEGSAEIIDNDIYNNATLGICITSKGRGVVRDNRIRNCKARGVWVFEGGYAVIENNEIYGNTAGQIVVDPTAKAELKDNR